MGAHLAESTAKDTGHVRATVFQDRVASSKHVSQLATVHLRVEFLLKTDSGYPKDTRVNKPW